MAHTLRCTVLFADLRGSTSLYETLGNAEATAVVTQSVALVAQLVSSYGGQVVKTLGDGLMAVFDEATQAVRAAEDARDSLARLEQIDNGRGPRRALQVQVALATGEVVEVNSDYFGDAVNVAARLLDHTGDNEMLVTDATLETLPRELQQRFRRLDKLHLRGRMEPVDVACLGARQFDTTSDAVATTFGDGAPAALPDGVRLIWQGLDRVFTAQSLPIIIGRSHEATYCIDDTRVSRSHAKVEWVGGNFQLVDLSSNGTFVRFEGHEETVTLRRGACTLHGRGQILLGVGPADPTAPTVRFEVLRQSDHDL